MTRYRLNWARIVMVFVMLFLWTVNITIYDNDIVGALVMILVLMCIESTGEDKP